MPRSAVSKRVRIADPANDAIAAVRPAGPELYHGEPAALHFADAAGSLALDVTFDKPRAVSVVDRWDERGRT